MLFGSTPEFAGENSPSVSLSSSDAPLRPGEECKEILDLLPQADSLSGDLLASHLNSIDAVILTLDALVGLVNLLLEVISGVLKTSGFVNDLLDSRSSRLESENQLRLLSRKLGVDVNDSIALSDCLVNVGLSNSNLVLVLLLVLAKLGALEVGLDGQTDLHTQTGLGPGTS